MEEILNSLLELDKSINFFTVIFRVFLAVLFGGIIGNERGKHGSQAGLRTHILVCLGSAMTALVGIYASESLGYTIDPFRISAQVVSGIGFLGAGMIIVKNGGSITGLTTAAGMWTTATIGIAIGTGFYSGAVLVAFACIFTAAFLTRIERKRKKSIHMYIEINNLSCSGQITDEIRDIVEKDCLLEIIPPKSGTSGHLGVLLVTSKQKNVTELRKTIEDISGVEFTVIE